MLVIPSKTSNIHKDSIKQKYPTSDENCIKMLNMYEKNIKPKYPMLDENLSKGTKRFNMDTTMISRNGVYACNSLANDKFKSNVLNIDLNSVRNIVSAVNEALSSMDLSIMGFTISEKVKEFIISFDVYCSDFEEEGRHEGFTLCMNKDTLKIDEYLDENISCEEIYYCLEDLLSILKVVEKNVVSLIISISKTGLPVNRAEFGLYNRYSASEMVVGQGTFENTGTVLTGVSLITKENRFKNIRKFEKYAMCLVF